jgi:hypothetical protein
MNSAVEPAVPAAVASWQETVAGSVTAPEYPGPITSDHAGGPEDYAPGSASGPVEIASSVPWFATLPVFEDVPGEVGDIGAEFGHAAPQATFDSNAGAPFAGSGPIAETHGFDTGGVYRTEYVPMPKAPGWWRRTATGQTYNATDTYDPTGKIVSTVNDRTDFDQYQGHNADASHPFWLPYSERPVLLNVAYEPVSSNDEPNAYNPSNDLSPVGPQFWTDTSNIYESPPDPQTSTASAEQTQVASAVGFWG